MESDPRSDRGYDLMDLDRLSLIEVRSLSKLIDLLGTPADVENLISVINICDGAAQLYRKQLADLRQASARHGE